VSIPELSAAIRELRDALQMIEGELDQNDLSSENLELFKVTVDNVRTSLLAVLSGVPPGAYAEHIERLRVQRASQLCANVHADVALGAVSGESTCLRDFVEAAKSLREKLAALKTEKADLHWLGAAS
jgi:uncharacterized protein YceH (UPF0502 family)